ncbi:DNA-directed RNA polymerase subunit alpha [Candidatus Parcubacteria bacterium]|nr:DNA-directed RNA polymerase subunit alpha [Candidatus Parcubacteria bacterium]
MKIALPNKINFEKGKDDNSSKVIIEPCFPGYGITLGNSLRRVLLSSLPGAAPVGVKIKGVDHEFSAVSHVKEDVLEFVLNLKSLRLKMFTDEPVKLELKVHGKKEITAADIKKNSSVEIVNPELVLGHITAMEGSIEAEITVEKGMGYEMLETREKKSKELGFMEMDSIFTPILSVGIDVKNARVGKMTNWDQLVLDIKTDGTITPEDAYNESVKILIEQFNAIKTNETNIANKKSEIKEDETENDDEVDEKKDEDVKNKK